MKIMNCTEFKNLVDDYCDSELSEELTARCDEHLSSCANCAGLLVAQEQLINALRDMPVAGPSEGFAERALRTAADQAGESGGNSVHHRHGFMVGFGSAAAAALAMWVVVGINPAPTPTPSLESNGSVELAKVEENVPEFSIALNEQRDIRLAFYSSTELNGAQITLQMPEHVTLVGFSGQRKLAWKANLVKGDNLLRLPVIATNSKGGQLVAQIEYMGKVKTLKVNFAVGAAGVSGSAGSTLRIV